MARDVKWVPISSLRSVFQLLQYDPEKPGEIENHPAGFLFMKPDSEERISRTTSQGENELWSSTNLYRHLSLLVALVPWKVRQQSL